MTSHRASSRPILAIIGPSGCGKSTVARGLASMNLLRLHPTWTTRPRRSDEQGTDLEHVFVTDDEFDRRDQAGFFIDSVDLFGLPYRYGLPWFTSTAAGPLDAVMLRAPVVSRFVDVMPDVVVYQIEDSAERARTRLVARGCTEAEISGRLDTYEWEVAAGRRLAHRTFVNDGPLGDLFTSVIAALAEDVTAEPALALGAVR